MIFAKFFKSIKIQLNALANLFWEADPIEAMRYEHDKTQEAVKAGREGLEEYRGLVENMTRKVQNSERDVAKLKARTQAFLKAGERGTAAELALRLKKAQVDLAEHQTQLAQHEVSYENHLKKFKHANESLGRVREKIRRYEADLKMSEAEAQTAKLSESFEFNVTTDFGQFETLVQERIDKNRGAVRVATDLSGQGIAEIEAEERMEASLAEDALRELEIDMGLITPETVEAPEVEKQLGPVTEGTT